MPLTISLVAVVIKTALEAVLNVLNLGNVKRHEGKQPEALKEVVDEETYKKACAYTKDKLSFGTLTDLYDAGILLLVLWFGVLPFLFGTLIDTFGSGVWWQAFSLILTMMIIGLVDLPFEWWSQFRIEARYGFNKSTFALWLSDKVKGTVIGLVLGWPLLTGIIALFRAFPETWWIAAFVLIFVFQLVMMVLYPLIIVPLFNKLSPLPDGELKTRLMDLSDRTGFKAKTIQVIDGSKRSGHSNAYFTGFGKFRRIVIYDTLMEQLSPEELEAVLAHEVGHYRRGHIPKMIAMSAVFMFAGLWLVSFLAQQPWFYNGFGFSMEQGVAPALLLFVVLSGYFTFWIGPMTNSLSRKHEYEADAFAKDAMKSHEPLVKALYKLHEKNLSNLTPHPLYSAYHYSHPTLTERVEALKKA